MDSGYIQEFPSDANRIRALERQCRMLRDQRDAERHALALLRAAAAKAIAIQHADIDLHPEGRRDPLAPLREALDQDDRRDV